MFWILIKDYLRTIFKHILIWGSMRLLQNNVFLPFPRIFEPPPPPPLHKKKKKTS